MSYREETEEREDGRFSDERQEEEHTDDGD